MDYATSNNNAATAAAMSPEITGKGKRPRSVYQHLGQQNNTTNTPCAGLSVSPSRRRASTAAEVTCTGRSWADSSSSERLATAPVSGPSNNNQNHVIMNHNNNDCDPTHQQQQHQQHQFLHQQQQQVQAPGQQQQSSSSVYGGVGVGVGDFSQIYASYGMSMPPNANAGVGALEASSGSTVVSQYSSASQVGGGSTSCSFPPQQTQQLSGMNHVAREQQQHQPLNGTNHMAREQQQQLNGMNHLVRAHTPQVVNNSTEILQHSHSHAPYMVPSTLQQYPGQSQVQYKYNAFPGPGMNANVHVHVYSQESSTQPSQPQSPRLTHSSCDINQYPQMQAQASAAAPAPAPYLEFAGLAEQHKQQQHTHHHSINGGGAVPTTTALQHYLTSHNNNVPGGTNTSISGRVSGGVSSTNTSYSHAPPPTSQGQGLGSGQENNNHSNRSNIFSSILKQRRGRWTPEEDIYSKSLIEEFKAGMLDDCDNGNTLRIYLSRKLHCAPMRISKKFAGTC
jgi:hypothetical protein